LQRHRSVPRHGQRRPRQAAQDPHHTGAGGIPVGYATLWIVYLAVGAGVVWILRRLARAPLAVAED